VRSPLALGIGGHADPWWDPDGRTGRRRRRRLLLQIGLFLATLALLMVAVGPRSARAATTVNLDQWASTDLAWQNGNLNGNNSRYPEGGIVPFRMAMEGLSVGNHTIHINYDVTARCGTATCTLSVTSNEPLTGTTDWTVVGPHSVQLRSSRDGPGNGRIYTVTVACHDTRGNASSNTTTVLVPHDQGKE